MRNHQSGPVKLTLDHSESESLAGWSWRMLPDNLNCYAYPGTIQSVRHENQEQNPVPIPNSRLQTVDPL